MTTRNELIEKLITYVTAYKDSIDPTNPWQRGSIDPRYHETTVELKTEYNITHLTSIITPEALLAQLNSLLAE